MTALRDALAAALLNDFGSHLTGTVAGIDATEMADAILSDPAFREALVEAVAEAYHADYYSYTDKPLPDWQADLDDCIERYKSPNEVARAIVARMLGDEA